MSNSFKIVSDSSCDLQSLSKVPFAVAPLKIITAEQEYTDDPSLNVKNMVDELAAFKGRSSTSCPNVTDWLTAFGDADNIFCFTITATLSGSYNSALLAKEDYETDNPSKKVFVVNTLTAGPEIALLIDKTQELILSGLAFEDICREIEEYQKKTALIFMLASMRNLANNGRVNPIIAKAAGILSIRAIGKASDQGDLQPLDKARGEDRAILEMAKTLTAEGYKGGRVRIAHCFNEDSANTLRSLITEKYPHADVTIYHCGGLCSFYAEKGGLLIGFEK